MVFEKKLRGNKHMICFRCINGIGNQMLIYVTASALPLETKESVVLVFDEFTKDMVN